MQQTITRFWAGDDVRNYFQPAICRCADGHLMMTLQEFKASDAFGPPSCSYSLDEGLTWSQPVEIPSFATARLDDRTDEGIADVRPCFHPQTSTVVALGCNTFYHRATDGSVAYLGEEEAAKRKQYPVYVVRDCQGRWSERRRLAHPFFAECADWRTANFQLVIEPDGDLLLPVYFRPAGRHDYAVCTIRCAFDGAEVAVRTVGSVLSLDPGSLGESSLTRFGGKYHLTLRAYDGRGYHAESADGLTWGPLAPWSWESGEPLDISPTQQHWLAGEKCLYLLYTRRTAENADVFRWRAPLFIAEVDADHGCLKQETEQIVFPLVRRNGGANHLGNFHAIMTEPGTAWVSDAPLWFRIEKGARPEDDRAVDFRSEVWLRQLTIA